MSIAFLGGVFDASHNEEIIAKTNTYVEYAANNFQRKIIEGLRECGEEPLVLSAPFLGAYPKAYREWYFRGFDPAVKDESGYEYVNFLNVWGLRNPARCAALKRVLKPFIQSKDEEKLIIVYTPHTPFLQAANYAKRKDPRIRICLVVPDLPQYMNLADHVSPVYRFLKQYDVKAFRRENRKVDSYVVLTEPMTEDLQVGGRPYCVVEGIYEPADQPPAEKAQRQERTIVYTGKLDRRFGIMELVEAFEGMEDENLRLVICGSGEERENVERQARQDRRIRYLGQVSSEEARQVILEGDVLVNPRKNDSDYTKYSFPSKIIDYLATGNPVVAYRLDGMPAVYGEFIHYVEGDGAEALRRTIRHALDEAPEQRRQRTENALRYLTQELSRRTVAEKILAMAKQE